MKVKIKKLVEIEILTLEVSAGVRYWEDATVNGEEDTHGDLVPCRNGDRWKPVIEIETGKIINWTHGTSATIHYKVCDDGVYSLQNEHGVAEVEFDGYVPKTLCPADRGYGDYIIMNIDEEGVIAGWKFNINDFINSED